MSAQFLILLGLALALVCFVLLIAGTIFMVSRSRRNKPAPPPSHLTPLSQPPPVAAGAVLKKCPQCQVPLAANAPEGLCPACVAKVALGNETAAPGATINVNPLAEAAPGTRVPPKLADLAAQFPQLEILELLGMGGMGMVYKARQPRLDRLVALKILSIASMPDASFAERFEREARALARLNHPGIVTLHDFGQTREYYYFIMEFVDGMNLRQLIRAKTMEPRQALELVMQICTALQFAHDEKIVHRDIKPENILITKKGQVKIADFGLAKLLSGQPDTSLTASQQVMGTFNYMAPEQRENAQKVDHRADIYSLGVVFYEMLTGEVPMGRFEAPSKKVQIDVRLDEVVLHALEREPARRYQHVSEVKSGVEAVTSTGPEATPMGASGPSPASPGPKPPSAFPPHSATEQQPAFRGQRASVKQKWYQMGKRGWLGVLLCLNGFLVSQLLTGPGAGMPEQQNSDSWIFDLGFLALACGFVLWGRAAWRRKKLTPREIRLARERGLWPPLGEQPSLEHVKRMVQAGETIMAIKLYRELQDASFPDAKAAVEKLDGQSSLEFRKGFELFPKEWSVTHAGHSIRVHNSWNRGLKLFVDDVCHASTNRIVVLTRTKPLLRYEMASGTSHCIIEVYCRGLLEVKAKIVVNGQWIGGDNF
jgi:serine/threonine protein kinase